MAKKATTGKKKKGAAKKSATKAAPALSEQSECVRAKHEVVVLQGTLADRTGEARQKTFEAEQMKEKLAANEAIMREEFQGTRDISADLIRQFKTMQSELMTKIMDLEEHEVILQEELDSTRKELAQTRKETARTMQEKDDLIASLTQRIQSMEGLYENVLTDALDAMASKVECARDRWAMESLLVQHRNKEALMEFGLSHSVSF